MDIDYKAPLSAEASTLISSSITKVWSEITNIDGWAKWQPDVTSARLDGPLTVGTQFYWDAKGLKIISKIQVCETPRSIGWTGKSLGMQAIHLWFFEEASDGTRVTTKESLSGWVPRLLRLLDPQFLTKSLHNSLRVLKTHVEGLP